ncbi:ABC transporter permease [Aeromonas sp. EERV15]|uniref:ABC transporter permease n=1 Tax=Aeromonas sp. EERV15 TaxID=1833892 RepID=UPI00083A3206|nr:ABC transporter permease subunit [Aeromonas sp. EERV15]
MRLNQNANLTPGSMVSTVAANTLRVALRDRTVIWLAFLFMAMVLLSAYLGWSATETVNQIYAKALPLLQLDGRPIPANPTIDMPPLSMLRNMTTYISLLGALVAIVLGFQMISEDLRSGVFPLISSRPIGRTRYAVGKIAALVVSIGGLLFLAAGTTALTVLLMPGVHLSPVDWVSLLRFYGVSALFLTAFGLMAMASAAWNRSESVGLLVPVTVWLVLTFVFPQLSANINPMAALNPVKAMVAPPAGAFFDLVGTALAPLSLVSAYRDVAATILGFTPADRSSLGMTGGMALMLAANLLLGALSITALRRLDGTRSNSDE